MGGNLLHEVLVSLHSKAQQALLERDGAGGQHQDFFWQRITGEISGQCADWRRYGGLTPVTRTSWGYLIADISVAEELTGDAGS